MRKYSLLLKRRKKYSKYQKRKSKETKGMRDPAPGVMAEDHNKNSIVESRRKNRKNTKDQLLRADKKIVKRKNIVRDHHK
jgi:hypothetical protein